MRIAKSESRQPRAKSFGLWRISRRRIFDCRSGEEKRGGQPGRVLMREARGLGVADRVTRRNASLTDLARRGDWLAVRKELIATQADVQHAMIESRDQKKWHI